MSERTCGTCRWWGDRFDKFDAREKHCTHIWDTTTELSEEEREQVSAIIDIPDDFDDVVGLLTRADFGCTLHEPRVQEPAL